MKPLDEHLDPESPVPDDAQEARRREPGTGRRMLRIAAVIAIGLALGFFFSQIEIAPVNDVGGIAVIFDLRAEIADPEAVVGRDFQADAIGAEQVADLKFLASLLDGSLRGVVGSQQKDGAEFGGLPDDIHLNLKETFFFFEFGGGIAHQTLADALGVLGAGVEGLERQHDDVGCGGWRGRRSGLRSGTGGEKKEEEQEEQ